MNEIDETHDPARRSWVSGADGHSEFPIQNLPLGIFAPAGGKRRAGVGIGDQIFDLTAIVSTLPDTLAVALAGPTLNPFFALGRTDRIALRRRLSMLFSDDTQRTAIEPHLYRLEDCVMHLPAAIGDYTDFYVGIHHANNVGRLFRPDHPLLPNYKWVPIGYHGRASSVQPSGVPMVRPKGQRKLPGIDSPEYGATCRLDYELELGVWMGGGNELGEPIPIADAADHIAGLCLLNDWSARDFQAWEYQPLGPFLSKNFHSTISPWVITVEALAPFRRAQPPRPPGDPQPLPYLWDEADQARGALGIDLEVRLSTASMRDRKVPPHRLSHGSATNMYWTIAQIVAHHTSNGCNVRPGDLFGTGTISAPDDTGLGSLLEISRGGTQQIALPGGETRTFLEDGDEVIMSAHAHAEGFVSIGFGVSRVIILPASSA